MRSRYYILRDNSLFIYDSRDQYYPSNIIPLKGMYINQLNDKDDDYYGLVISHD